MKAMKTINEVCKMLGLTSRTIRYYEEFGLIQTFRESKTAPRRLDSENIERLRRIRFLRKLGLTLGEIAGVIDSEKRAGELIQSKNIELKAEINALILRVNLLQEVITATENGENIFSLAQRLEQPPDEPEMLRIAAECTKLIVEGRFSELAPYLNTDMRRMPPEILRTGWEVHVQHCGAFLSVGAQSIVADTVINRLHYEKQDVAILIEVHAGTVTGMLLRYWKEDA